MSLKIGYVITKFTFVIMASLSICVHTNNKMAYAYQQNPADQFQAGEVIAMVDGKQVSLPLLKADYDVDINGHVATISLKQTFLNRYLLAAGKPLHRQPRIHAGQPAIEQVPIAILAASSSLVPASSSLLRVW